MRRYSEAPAAIEGAELSVSGQDIIPSSGPPRKMPGSEDLIFPLSVKKRGKSEILVEYSPKRWRFKESSDLDRGSRISGKNLWGFSSQTFRPDNIRVGGSGRTSSHSGQDITINGTCFMQIIQGYIGNSLLTHPKKELLSSK